MRAQRSSRKRQLKKVEHAKTWLTRALTARDCCDTVVETASLSSLVPPKTKHKLRLCAKAITQGLLTSVKVPPSPRWGVSCPRAGALVCTHNSWLGACWRSELRAQLARRLLWREPVSSNGSFGG